MIFLGIYAVFPAILTNLCTADLNSCDAEGEYIFTRYSNINDFGFEIKCLITRYQQQYQVLQLDSIKLCYYRCVTSQTCMSFAYRAPQCYLQDNETTDILNADILNAAIDIFYFRLAKVNRTEYNITNIALGRESFASSVAFSGSASRAVDGGTSPAYYDNQCSHTHRDLNPWWAVALETTRVVLRVRIFNRALDLLRLHDFDIYASNDVENPLESRDKQLCYHYAGYMASRAVETLACISPLPARYISIIMAGHIEFLHLCEVQVFGV